MWKRKPETAVCPTCRMVHQPDYPIGEFRLYCRTHRRPLEDARERRNNVLAWVDRNFDKVAKQYDEHVAMANAQYAKRNQASYASMAQASVPAQGAPYGHAAINGLGSGPDA